jgi:hypothetical protein
MGLQIPYYWAGCFSLPCCALHRIAFPVVSEWCQLRAEARNTDNPASIGDTTPVAWLRLLRAVNPQQASRRSRDLKCIPVSEKRAGAAMSRPSDGFPQRHNARIGISGALSRGQRCSYTSAAHQSLSVRRRRRDRGASGSARSVPRCAPSRGSGPQRARRRRARPPR